METFTYNKIDLVYNEVIQIDLRFHSFGGIRLLEEVFKSLYKVKLVTNRVAIWNHIYKNYIISLIFCLKYKNNMRLELNLFYRKNLFIQG